MNKKILWILVFILLVSPIIAQPPTNLFFQLSTSPGSLEIKVPPILFYETEKTIEFPFHVFNISTGLPLNTDISCEFHLYDNRGGHLFTQVVNDTSDTTFDYEFEVDKNNFTRSGSYAYLTQCNNSAQGGFASLSFEVNNAGQMLSTSQAIFYFIAIIITLVLFLVCLLSAWGINPDNIYDVGDEMIKVNINKYVRIGLFFFSYLFLLFLVYLGWLITDRFLFLEFTAVTLRFFFMMLIIALPIIFILTIYFMYIKLLLDLKINEMAQRGLKNFKKPR